jgi:hypothetical protein
MNLHDALDELGQADVADDGFKTSDARLRVRDEPEGCSSGICTAEAQQ